MWDATDWTQVGYVLFTCCSIFLAPQLASILCEYKPSKLALWGPLWFYPSQWLLISPPISLPTVPKLPTPKAFVFSSLHISNPLLQVSLSQTDFGSGDTPGFGVRGLIPGSVLTSHSWQCSGDLMWCQEPNQSEPFAKQAPKPSYSLSNLPNIFLRILQQDQILKEYTFSEIFLHPCRVNSFFTFI